jgi:hypothetical protein
VTEVQITNAEQVEVMARQEVEADAAVGKIPPYGVSKARREHFLALLAQRQLEQVEGKLVEVRAVNQMLFEEARRARDRLLGIPARLSAELHAQKDSASLAIVLEKEIHRILTELSEGTARGMDRLAEGTGG